MIIGVDANNNIKQLRTVTDPTLIIYDTDTMFNDWSDIRILNYCYVVRDGVVSIYPAIDLTQIDILELKQQIVDLNIAMAAMMGGTT